MRKVFVLLCLLLVISACKKEVRQDAGTGAITANFDIGQWPKKTIVNAKANDILKEWPEYIAFENSFERIYTIENTEDLELIIEDLIEGQKVLAESTYPEPFDKPHIKGRQVALKTYILKTKGSLEYRLDLQEPITQMIDAFNALRNQFNVIVNSSFDARLILEEQQFED